MAMPRAFDNDTRTLAAYGFYVEASGMRLFARTAGPPSYDGPVVILIHGLVISSLYMVPLLKHLAPFCRVYAPDLPGYGRSQKLRHALNVSELADALVSWMDAVGITTAHLVGNSYGCNIIAEILQRYSHRAEKAVLQGPTTDVTARSFVRQLCRFIRDARYERLSILFLMIRDYIAAGVRVIIETVHFALADRIEEKLPSITLPVLVVRGERDPLVPQHWAEYVTSLLPNGQLKVVPGAGHAINYSAPLELVRVLRPFLDL